MQCIFNDCNKPVYMNGACETHYNQYYETEEKWELAERPNKALVRKQRMAKGYKES